MASRAVTFVNRGQQLWSDDELDIPRVGDAVKLPKQQGQYEVKSVGYDYSAVGILHVIVQVEYLHGTDRFYRI